MYDELTYVVVHCNAMRVFIRYEYWNDVREAIKNRTTTDFIDVDGEKGILNGRKVDAAFISTPTTRAQQVLDSKEEEKESWQ